MFDVTLSLHGHAEDHLFIHSLRSAEATCEAANRNGIRAELLIVLDAPTPKTKAVASSSTYTASRIKIVENKDLGLSRNDAVREANAPFIAFLDGDDLVSENWLLESYRYYETLTDRRTILHTEVMVGIHDENWVRFQIESDQTEFTAFELSQNWYFCNNSFAPRDIYLSLPFQRSRRNESLGAEDWKWSADSITRGFVHHYVPRTAYYYRRQHQRLSLGHTGGMQVMPSGLFNVQNIALWGQENYFKTLAKYVPEYVPATPGMPLAQQAARLYDSLTTAPSNEVLGPLPSSERHQVYRFPRVDDWLLEDWTRQHSIDPRVYPSKRRLAELTLFHPVPCSREGLALLLALCLIQERPVVIMLAPFFRHGGGERMVIAYLNAFRRECPDRSVVLLRLRDENVSYDGLDENVIVVELSRIFARLAISPGASQHALLRILIERAPDVFWTVNNDFGLDALGEFGNAIGTNSLRATSIFGPGLTVDGYAGYAVTRIPSLADKLDLLVADNEAILRTLRTVFAIDAEKMLFCPAPAASWVTSPQKEESPKENPQRQAPMRVLWFSRLDFEKRVDLLLATASLFAASEAVFVVYGAAVVGDTTTDYVKALKEHPSIEYRGEFEAIDVLAKDHFDAYLYTSASDGFPFVLLEAAAMDLPIVASDVGGVGEVIGDKTGYLVSAKDDPQAYAEALRKIRNNPGEAAERARELRRWIATERSQARFDAAVRSILARAQTAISGDA